MLKPLGWESAADTVLRRISQPLYKCLGVYISGGNAVLTFTPSTGAIIASSVVTTATNTPVISFNQIASTIRVDVAATAIVVIRLCINIESFLMWVF